MDVRVCPQDRTYPHSVPRMPSLGLNVRVSSSCTSCPSLLCVVRASCRLGQGMGCGERVWSMHSPRMFPRCPQTKSKGDKWKKLETDEERRYVVFRHPVSPFALSMSSLLVYAPPWIPVLFASKFNWSKPTHASTRLSGRECGGGADAD